jgi:predicted AAA+ superfamily ATPase
MLKRKILESLIEWKDSKRKKALLIKGARQIGKTFIIRELGKLYKNFIEINFEKEPKYKEAFTTGSLSAETIIFHLSAMGITNFEQKNTLIFFDEIQSCPQARTAIKFLVEDGRYDYIECGSLLGINYKEVSSYPVGYEQQLSMYPIDFEEFLWAKKIGQLAIDQTYKCYKELQPVPDFLHNQMFKLFREYLIVGGMPSAVNAFVSDPNFNETLAEHRSIINSYRDDIAKYAKQKILVRKMFNAIPEQLNDKNKHFKLSQIDERTFGKKFEDASDWLVEAGIGYLCYNVKSLELPLAFYERQNMFKLYLHDTGILCSLLGKGIQYKLLTGELDINEGSIIENAVANMLVKNEISLNYYDKKSKIELDFVFFEDNKISVIEVKSGKSYKQHASLNKISEMFKDQIGRRIILCKQNVEVDESGAICLPIYMGMYIKKDYTSPVYCVC